MRLDRALHVRGLARSRSHAQDLIRQGAVTVNGVRATKPSAECPADGDLVVARDDLHYVSRAAHKLIGALDACAPYGFSPTGLRALDAGASTGGFTQVLLERGAVHVLALDVGHGQLDPTVSADPRVHAVEGVNARDLTSTSDGAGVEVVVADLSFISLTLVVPALVEFADARAEFLLMVKPQFEVGKSGLNGRGVVTDVKRRRRAIHTVAETMREHGITVHHIARSDLPGPQGNVEYFVWASGSWQASDDARGGRPDLRGSTLEERIAAVVDEE